MRIHLTKIQLRYVERSVGAVALIFGLTGTGWSVYTQKQDADQVNCQAQINQKFEEIITTRSALSSENTQNINDLIVALVNSTNGTPDKQKIISHYLTELAKVQDELRRATFPSIGNC